MVTSIQTIASFISTIQSHLLDRDAARKIWDSWYDGQNWNQQQINLTGMTPGPATVGDPLSFLIDVTQPQVVTRRTTLFTTPERDGMLRNAPESACLPNQSTDDRPKIHTEVFGREESNACRESW